MKTSTYFLLRAAIPGLTLADLAALKRLLTRPELDAYAQARAERRLN